jgi:hypothetical protein
MGQGGKSSGKGGKGEKGGKPSGKGGKGEKAGKGGKDSSKKQQNNQNSMSVLSSICCLSIVYSIVMAYLGGTAIKTVGDNPQLAAMAMSDNRLKKNVKQMTYGLKELTQLETKSYNYVNENDTTTRHLGVMAQDLQQIMPELVAEIDAKRATDFKAYIPSDTNTVYAVKYQEIVPVLINAIKELKSEVDTLKQQMH